MAHVLPGAAVRTSNAILFCSVKCTWIISVLNGVMLFWEPFKALIVYLSRASMCRMISSKPNGRKIDVGWSHPWNTDLVHCLRYRRWAGLVIVLLLWPRAPTWPIVHFPVQPGRIHGHKFVPHNHCVPLGASHLMAGCLVQSLANQSLVYKVMVWSQASGGNPSHLVSAVGPWIKGMLFLFSV